MPRKRPLAAGPASTLGTRVPRSLRYRLRLYCLEQDRTMQEFIIEALREHLAVRQRGR